MLEAYHAATSPAVKSLEAAAAGEAPAPAPAASAAAADVGSAWWWWASCPISERTRARRRRGRWVGGAGLACSAAAAGFGRGCSQVTTRDCGLVVVVGAALMACRGRDLARGRTGTRGAPCRAGAAPLNRGSDSVSRPAPRVSFVLDFFHRAVGLWQLRFSPARLNIPFRLNSG